MDNNGCDDLLYQKSVLANALVEIFALEVELEKEKLTISNGFKAKLVAALTNARKHKLYPNMATLSIIVSFKGYSWCNATFLLYNLVHKISIH